MSIPPIRMMFVVGLLVGFGVPTTQAQVAAPKPDAATPAADQAQPAEAPANPADATVTAKTPLESPPPIPPATLVPTLRTIPVRRGFPGYNVQMVDAAPLPRDKSGIWVLDFAFKPVRLVTVEVGGKRKIIHYLYYRVINHSAQARMFVPQFSLVTDTGHRYEDAVLPQAVKIIQAREDPSIPLHGAVNIMGMVPPSTKEGIDDAVFGVAVWEGVDPAADRFKIYVRGLSDGYQLVNPPDGGKAVVRYKTLRIDLIRRGDERHLTEKEIQLLDPPYEWVYW